METEYCDIESLIELETKEDGDSFFHAAFGEKHSGMFQTFRSNEMRMEWYNFLCQFTDLSDKSMPSFLKDQLEKIFNLFFLNVLNSEGLSESVGSIRELVCNRKLAIAEAETKADKLVQDILEKCLNDADFRNNIFNITMKARLTQISEMPTINDLLDDLNMQLLKYEIKNCLESCALFYLSNSKEEYNSEYNSEFIANALFESKVYYRGYLEAIQSSSYAVLFEEVPIIASLANIEIRICYEDIAGRKKFEIFVPNEELLKLTTSYDWTEKKQVIIIHKLNHFSRAQLNPMQSQNAASIMTNALLSSSVGCQDKSSEPSTSQAKESSRNVDAFTNHTSMGPCNSFECDDLEGLPDPSSFNIHRFTSKATDKTPDYHFQSLQELSGNNLSLTNYTLEHDVSKFGYPSNTTVASPEYIASRFTSLQLPAAHTELLAFQDQPFKRSTHIFGGKPNLVIKEINRRTGTFYHGELGADDKMSGTGKLYSKDEKQYIDGDWRNDRLIKVNVCKFLHPRSVKTVNSKIYGEEGLLILDQDCYVARINIGDLEEIDFCNPNVTFIDIQRKVFDKLTTLKILEDKTLSVVDVSYNNFKQVLYKRSTKTAYGLKYAEDLVQLRKTLDNYKVMKKDYSLNSNTLILKDLLTNTNISTEIRTATEQLFGAETSLHTRNQTILQINVASSSSENLLKDLEQICEDLIEHHRTALLDKCNSNAFLALVRSSVFKLSTLELLCISGLDIQLLSGLINTAHEQKFHTYETQAEVTSLLLELVKHFWDMLIKLLQNSMVKIDSLQEVAPLTNPIYLGLYKSFVDLMTEFCMKTHISARNVLINKKGEWMIAASISWLTPHKHNFLEQQLRFIFTLLKHFKPCLYRNRKRFDYNLKLLKDDRTVFSKMFNFVFGNNSPKSNIAEGLSEEQLIWLYILDDAMASIIQHQREELRLSKETEEQITDFALLLLKTFVEFISLENNRYESFRVVAHNVIKFVAQVGLHFVKMSEGDLDHSILLKQISFIKFTILQQDCKLLDCFPGLINVFSAYWDCKVSLLTRISELLPYESFKSDKEEMTRKILEVVDAGLDQKVNPQVLMKFFRVFNELLKLLQAVEFEWIVKEHARTNELLSNNVISVVNADKRSYLVLKPKEFIEDFESSAGSRPIPTHYIIEIVKTLFVTIHSSLAKTDLDTETNANQTCKLILTIGHSFIHFKDQSDYVDLDQFLEDSTQPFLKVLKNISSYQDFEKRIDNIETFYLYTRIQDEIDITKALDLFESESEALHNSGFDTTFNKEILKSCFEKYREQFNSYIEQTSNDLTNIHIILKDIGEMVTSTDNVDIDKWTPDFKQNTLPILLAGLGAVWSLHNSKDIISTGKSLKPHCIQILCILRLLSVDQRSVGMGNHLAQILTGQGKSVILGFLSTILALLGSPVRVVCYSQYLAHRDKLAFKEFFAHFKVSEKIVYGTFKDMSNEVLSLEIHGRKLDLRTLIHQCVLNKLEKQSDTLKSTVSKIPRSVLLIDEVDVFFSDTFYGSTYNASVRVNFPALLEIQTEIWKFVSSGMHTPDAVLRQIDGLIKHIVQSNKDEVFSAFLSTTEFLFKKHLKMMIDNAITVATSSSSSWLLQYYKLTGSGEISCRKNDGLYSTNVLHDYFNVFMYFRLKGTDYDHMHFKNFGYLKIRSGSISYANLPKEYSIISGVSGTLTTLNGPEKEAIKSYDVNNISCMPSFFGRNKLVFNEIEHFTQEIYEENWLTTIYNHVSDTIQCGRSVIVFFENESNISKFKEQFESSFECLHVLTGNEDPLQLEWIINEAGVARTVTLATPPMGRGVDFKSNDSSVEAQGGVHLIQTFFSLDEKEEIQIKGRTARKSNNGSYELILCKEHLNRNSLHILRQSYQDLCYERTRIAEKKGKNNTEKIRKSQEMHDQTLEFLHSFSNYTPDKRNKYLNNPVLKKSDEKT